MKMDDLGILLFQEAPKWLCEEAEKSAAKLRRGTHQQHGVHPNSPNSSLPNTFVPERAARGPSLVSFRRNKDQGLPKWYV